MSRASRIRDRGLVSHRHEADAKLERPGDFVLVNRGVLRSFVLQCPDDCGERLTINLDPRTAKAWRLYRKRKQVSIFPSVWRDTGCGSHFIIWNHNIVWCNDEIGDSDVVVEDEATLQTRLLPLCTSEWQHFTQLAEALDEVPWDVNRACLDLARRERVLVEGADKLRGFFKLASR